MALVSATEMLQKAKAGHYAVGQFNINNLEWTKAILLTAQECNSPVILGVSEGSWYHYWRRIYKCCFLFGKGYYQSDSWFVWWYEF